MKTLKNKNIVRLLILISLIVVVGISFIVTTAVYKGTHIGSGSLVLDKGIYIDVTDVSSGELSKNMEMPIQYYPNKVTSEGNRIEFSVSPSSEMEYYIANPTITAQDSSQAFYLRLKLNAQYYVNGSSTPTTFSMSASEKNTLFQLFATDSNYSPVLFNDCFAADANGEYYYYVSGGYGVATKNNLAQVTSGMEISLFKGFLANGTTPVSVINFREFEKVPENVTNITLSLDIELAIEPNNWNLPDVTLLTENDVTVSLVDNEYEITKINTSATSYALPGYYQGNAITRIGTTSPSALDEDAAIVWFANTMTHIGGYSTSKIQKFYLGNNVTEICEWAFYGTNELSGNLVLPISITKIGDDSFGVVTTISCLFPYLPNCEYFGSGSFKGDSGFYGILSVRGVIGSTAFANVSVRTLNIEAGTTSIGTDSFYGMQGLRRVFIDSSAIAGLASSDSCLLDISNNVSLQDVYIKDGLTIGAYFTSDSNFVETESNVAGYRHFGRSYQLTFNGGNIDGTLDAKLWNYAGSAGYSSSNTGNNSKYSFSGKNATTKIGINGVNTFDLPMPIISGYTFDGWYTTANGSSETVKVATADGWIANVSGYTSENGSWIRANATTLYAHYTKKEYSISYDFAGGTKGTNAPSSYIFGNTTAISNPTRAGYTFVGWNISVSLTGKSFATIDINTGVQEYVASYPNAVYYELFYAHQGISYTAALSGGQIRWRKYTTAGAFGGNVSTSSQYAPTDNMYVALWYHLGKEDNNTIYTYNYIGDNLSIDSLQVGNLTLTAKWVQNNSYLLIANSWKSNLASAVGGSISNINSILFTQDASKTPSGKTGVSVGATDIDGQTAYSNMRYVSDITAYVVANGSKYDVIFYSPCPMYAPTDSSNLFNNLTGLTNIEFAALKTNKVTNMARMFQKDSSLTSISLSSLDTSLVIDLKGMFDGCTMLTSLDLSSFNTLNVTSISGMFKNCSNLETLNISSFNTSKITGMSQTFMGCGSLRTIDLSNFDTSLVTTMNSLFYECTELREVKLGSKFVTTNVQNMNSMFYSCKNLESSAINVLLNRFNTSKVTTMSNMFNGCLKLISIDLNTFDMSNVTDTTDMLANCEQLRVIKTPVALSSTAIILPYGTWYDEDDLSVGYTKIEKSLVTGGWKTIRPGYSVTYNAIATKDYSESNLRREYAKGNYFSYETGSFDEYQKMYDLTKVYPDLATYSSIKYAYLQILPKVTSRWTNSSSGVISAEAYVLGNAQYHVRVPRGYYIEIKQIDYENNELSQSWTLGKEYVSGESDFEESIVTNSKTHKLVFTLRHSTKSLTPSNIETSALANLHVTLESPIVTNIWYGQDIPMVSSYSPGMNFHDTIKSMTGVANTKGEYNQTFVSFDTATSLGDITQIVTYSPITYTIKLKTGNGKYNDQSGTITLGTGYMGQKIDIKRSLITLPIGNLLKSITQSGKGQFVDIGAYGNNLFTDFDEWQYQIGAGDATLTLKFTPMTFDVSFDANGGNVAPSTISVSYGSAYGELPTPSRTGYTFAGWLGGSKNLLKGSVSQNGWSGTYSLLNANTNKFSFRVHTGGSAGSCWRSFYIDVSKYIGQTITISGTISAINPTNGEVSYISVGQGNNDSYPYHIAGSSDSKRIYNKGDAVGTTFSHTCTIIDGTSIMGICIWANITAANGYVDVVFDNLQIEAGNKATAFENPNTVITANSKVTLPYAHTLTAKWTPKEYTVTFNANGGTTSTASKKVTYDSTYGTLPTPSAYSKTGYIVTFNGWYTAKTGGTHVTASTTVKITGNQTLYAHWIETPITYTIVYNGNGYTNGSTASSTHTYNSAKTLTANGFGKTGYTFIGWATSATGAVVYSNQQSVTNLSSTNGATITLYAKWQAKQFTVSFNPSEKGGLLTDVANGTYSGNNATITYTSSSHQYKFVNSSTNDPYVTIASTVYLVAGRTYTIHAKMRNTSGSVISGSIQIFYAINQAYNESDSRRLSGGEGRTTLTVSSTGTYNIRIDNDYDKDIVIYEFYIIEGDFITSKTVTYDSTYGTLPTPLREGYTFAGWYTLSSGGSQITDSTKVTKANDYTLFAHWTENTKAYLMTGTNWQAKLKSANSNYTQANIESIEFTKTKPTSGTRVSVGAVNSNGTSAYVSGTSGVSDVTAYVTAGSASGKYKVVFYSNATIYAPVNSSYLFSASTSSSQLKALKSIAFNNFNTSNVTNMSNMFDNCALLTSLDLSKFDTSKVTNMQSMFNNCTSLTSLNLTSFNTAKVTNMRMMFYNVKNVSLNLSKFDTSNVTNMSWMFAQANVPSLSNFNTAKVTDMSYMFFLSSATSIDLSSFNTSNVTNMSYMFSGCGNLSSLDLSNFDMSKVTNTNYMLNNFTELGGFTTLKTPKKLAKIINLPFDFVNTSGTTTYTQVSTSMTNMTLLRKWYRVTCPTSGNWEKSQLTCSVDGLVGSSNGVRVAYNTTITFWLKTTGYAGNYSYIYMTFSGFAESEVIKGSSSGNVESWRVYYSGSQRYASMIIDNEQFEIGITDDRTNVEEIELKDTFIIEDHDDEIVPMWFMPLISCQLVCRSTVAMKAYSNITAKITSDCYIAAAAGSGKGYTMGSYI